MELPLKALVLLLAIMALATVCNPFTPGNTLTAAPTQYPQDLRSAEFAYKSDEEPTVQDQMDSVNLRWSNMETSGVHVAVEYSPAFAFIPAQNPEFWLTVVATIPDETIRLLAEGETTNILLPGVYPHLYECVPQECKLTTIDLRSADRALASDKSSIPDDFGSMNTKTLAMSEDCYLLVFTALGHS